MFLRVSFVLLFSLIYSFSFDIEDVVFDFEKQDVVIEGKNLKMQKSKYYNVTSKYFKKNIGITSSISSKKSLGIKVGWSKDYFGMKNFDVLIPKKKLNRDVKKVILFIWSARYIGKAYLRINDFEGKERFLLLTDLNFVGWKRVVLNVPSFINGKVDYRPLEKILNPKSVVIKGLRIEIDKKEKRDIYLFFDRMSYFFDTIVQHDYDGADVENLFTVKEENSKQEEGEEKEETKEE